MNAPLSPSGMIIREREPLNLEMRQAPFTSFVWATVRVSPRMSWATTTAAVLSDR